MTNMQKVYNIDENTKQNEKIKVDNTHLNTLSNSVPIIKLNHQKKEAVFHGKCSCSGEFHWCICARSFI